MSDTFAGCADRALALVLTLALSCAFVLTLALSCALCCAHALARSLRGSLNFTLVLLIATGWIFVKPFLNVRDKTIFATVLPLQVRFLVASSVCPFWFGRP